MRLRRLSPRWLLPLALLVSCAPEPLASCLVAGDGLRVRADASALAGANRVCVVDRCSAGGATVMFVTLTGERPQQLLVEVDLEDGSTIQAGGVDLACDLDTTEVELIVFPGGDGIQVITN